MTLPKLSSEKRKLRFSGLGFHVNGHHIPWGVIVLAVTILLTGDRAFNRLELLEKRFEQHMEDHMNYWNGF